MKIEDVCPEDAGELLGIYGPYVTGTAITFEYEVPTLSEFTDRIINITKKFPYLKAVSETGEILGYAYAAAFKTRAAYQWSVETTVYVKQDVRRGGIGKALYEELEARLKKIGILNMNACIALPRTKDDPYLTMDSPLFHKKMGFKQCARFHKCAKKFDRWYDTIWMEKSIGRHS